MKTITIQIGNSDGKLDQRQWSFFVEQCSDVINSMAMTVHFKGGPPVWEPWINVCWVLIASSEDSERLKHKLKMIRERFSQDSMAWTEGETEMI